MENYLKEALEIVKAQASVRTMSEEEIISMLQKLVVDMKAMYEGNAPVSEPEDMSLAIDPAKAIREKSICCAVCGQSFKILSKKHLALHELTPEEYRERCGYKKGLPLVCKALQRERRKKMQDMKLWERRGAAK